MGSPLTLQRYPINYKVFQYKYQVCSWPSQGRFGGTSLEFGGGADGQLGPGVWFILPLQCTDAVLTTTSTF